MRKKTGFWLVLIATLVLTIDSFFYFALYEINKSRNLFYGRTEVSPNRIHFWLKNSYNPALGWDLPKDERNNLGTRRNQDYPKKDRYKIKIFGDSFTYGAEVDVDHTFESYVEKTTGWDCLNYGVGAFGPDQALLKYQITEVKSEYTILGILCENIGRVASIYPAFYMREWAPPKPKFVKQDGKFELIANPISSPDSAINLLNEGFVAKLKRMDYWPDYYEKKLGAPATLTWPASSTILRHLPFFINRVSLEIKKRFSPDYDSELQTYKYYHLYQDSTEALQTLDFIIGEFIGLAESRQERPLIMVFPDQFSLDIIHKYGKNPYQPLVSYLRRQKYEFIDIGELFASEDYAAYYNYYNSHFSPRGNARVAEALVSRIKALDSNQSKSHLTIMASPQPITMEQSLKH